MRNDGVEANEAVNLLFGLNGMGKTGARRAMARIRDVAPEAFGELKGAHFMKLVTGHGGGDFLPPAKIRSNIQKAIVHDGAMMKTLYGDDLGDLNRFANNLAAKKNPVEGIVEFIQSKPGISSFVMGTATGGASYGLTDNPAGSIFAGLLGMGFARRAQTHGRPIHSSSPPSALANAAKAARPGSAQAQRIGTNIGSTLAAAGPSLSN